MRRSSFLATLTAAGATSAMRATAAAQVGPGMLVFDPSQYANMITSLGHEAIIDSNSVTTATNVIALYKDSITQGLITAHQAWPDLVPQLQKLIAATYHGANVPLDANDVLTYFTSRFPKFDPNQPFRDLFAIYKNAASDAIRASMTIASSVAKQVGGELSSLYDIINVPPQGRNDMLKISNMLGYQMATQLANTRTLIADQLSTQGHFYETVLGLEDEKRRNPGVTYLQAALNDVPEQLRHPERAKTP